MIGTKRTDCDVENVFLHQLTFPFFDLAPAVRRRMFALYFPFKLPAGLMTSFPVFTRGAPFVSVHELSEIGATRT